MVDLTELAYAALLRDTGLTMTMTEIVAKSGITRASVCCDLPPRMVDQLMVGLNEVGA